jgi:hypothetical protein
MGSRRMRTRNPVITAAAGSANVPAPLDTCDAGFMRDIVDITKNRMLLFLQFFGASWPFWFPSRSFKTPLPSRYSEFG